MSTNLKKVLIVGGDSLIGARLRKKLSTQGKVLTLSITRAKCLDTKFTILENFELNTNPSAKFNNLIKKYR